MIYPLDEFVKYLNDRDISSEKITGFIKNLKNNLINNILYLPHFVTQFPNFEIPESIVRFDKITTLKTKQLSNFENIFFRDNNDGDVFFTLSNYGFYLLLFKLSVFFCRFKEGIDRNKIED